MTAFNTFYGPRKLEISQIEHMYVLTSHGLFLVILKYLFCHLNIKSFASL